MAAFPVDGLFLGPLLPPLGKLQTSSLIVPLPII